MRLCVFRFKSPPVYKNKHTHTHTHTLDVSPERTGVSLTGNVSVRIRFKSHRALFSRRTRAEPVTHTNSSSLWDLHPEQTLALSLLSVLLTSTSESDKEQESLSVVFFSASLTESECVEEFSCVTNWSQTERREREREKSERERRERERER